MRSRVADVPVRDVGIVGDTPLQNPHRILPQAPSPVGTGWVKGLPSSLDRAEGESLAGRVEWWVQGREIFAG